MKTSSLSSRSVATRAPSSPASPARRAAQPAARFAVVARAFDNVDNARIDDVDADDVAPSRRRALLLSAGGVAAVFAASVGSPPPPALAASANGAGAATVEDKVLCDAACEAALKEAPLVELPSGLSFRDVKVGSGPEPPVGFQVVAHYVAMTPNGKVFDSSLNRGAPYDFRIGAGQIVPGLDEGIKTMKAGGLRRVYVPGPLSFPKGLPSGPGRPRVPPASPVVFDVELLYIPGLDDE